MDPGTIGLLVAEGSALAAIAAAYSLGREPTKTTTSTVPPTETAAPAPAPAPTPVETATTPAPAPASVETATTPVETTAAPAPASVETTAVTTPVPTPVPTPVETPAPASVETPPVQPSSGEDPAPVTVNVPPEPEKTLDEIVNEAILKAEIDQYTPEQGSVFQRLNPRARMNAARINRASTIAARKQGGRRRTFRKRRGGEASFEKRVSSKLYSLKDSDPRPQTAFKTLVTVKEDRVATLLLPVFNAFVWWRYKVRIFPIRYSPILVADADTLFDDALKVYQDIHPIFLKADRSFKAEWMKTGKNPFLEGTNPFPQAEQNPFSNPEQKPEQNPFTQPEQKPEQNPFLEGTNPFPKPEQNPFLEGTNPFPQAEQNPLLKGTNPFPQAEQNPFSQSQSAALNEPAVKPDTSEVTPPTTAVIPAKTGVKPPPPPPPAKTGVKPPPLPPPPSKTGDTKLDNGTGTGLFTNEQLDAAQSKPLEIPPELKELDDAQLQPLEIPPELQVKLNAAREKFETLKAKITNEEKKPESPFAKPESKERRAETASRAADTRRRNKLLAARDVEIEKANLEFRRKKANEARDARARKRAGIVSQPVIVETTEPSMEATVESVLGTAEASTNEIADSLKALEPTSASQNWFMDIENELQMYFEYYNQVERDLADVPPAQPASIPVIPQTLPTLPTISREQKDNLQLRNLTPSNVNRINTKGQRYGIRKKGGTPKKRKQKKTRKLTFRRSRKQ